ncbi:MAG: hypothetical protein GXO48_04315 [Chlorobi bacterium]|nr:hypothetical protein [Chlorobiota bacterium]
MFLLQEVKAQSSWVITYGHQNLDSVTDFCTTYDGVFALTGIYTNNNQKDVIFCIIDTTGTLHPCISAGNPQYDDIAYGIAALPDTTFVIVGKTFASDQQNGDGFIARIGRKGTILWAKAIGTPTTDEQFNHVNFFPQSSIITAVGYSTAVSFSGIKEGLIVQMFPDGSNEKFLHKFGSSLYGIDLLKVNPCFYPDNLNGDWYVATLGRTPYVNSQEAPLMPFIQFHTTNLNNNTYGTDFYSYFAYNDSAYKFYYPADFDCLDNNISTPSISGTVYRATSVASDTPRNESDFFLIESISRQFLIFSTDSNDASAGLWIDTSQTKVWVLASTTFFGKEEALLLSLDYPDTPIFRLDWWKNVYTVKRFPYNEPLKPHFIIGNSQTKMPLVSLIRPNSSQAEKFLLILGDTLFRASCSPFQPIAYTDTPIIPFGGAVNQGTQISVYSSIQSLSIQWQSTSVILSYSRVQATALQASFQLDSPSCYGYSDGSIQIQLLNGQPPYQYNWNTGATTQTITNIPAGTYTVTVSDANNCIKTFNITLAEPQPLTTDIDILFGNNKVIAIPNGGTPPYSISWNNGHIGDTLTVQTSGSYWYTVTDVNGCSTTSDSFHILLPMTTGISQISSLTSGNITCNIIENDLICSKPVETIQFYSISGKLLGVMAPGTPQVRLPDFKQHYIIKIQNGPHTITLKY